MRRKGGGEEGERKKRRQGRKEDFSRVEMRLSGEVHAVITRGPGLWAHCSCFASPSAVHSPS